MAYFSALGGTGGTSATITVTYSEDFYGLTITATNGTTTLTKTATSSGTLTFDVSEGGTWVVSGTVEGATYSESVDVTFEYTAPPLVALPDGSTALPVNDIQMWLKCAGIRDKSYTTLSQVLADTETLIALCADSNACDYMARSTNWASGVAADSTAMLIVGKYNYCANALLGNSTWASAIANSTYFEYVCDAVVPKLSSNTASVLYSTQYDASSYPAYKAFDRTPPSQNSQWLPTNGATNNYIGYDFGTDKSFARVYVDLYYGPASGQTVPALTFKVQGYTNDAWSDIDEFTIEATSETKHVTKGVDISLSNTYSKMRLFCATALITSAYGVGVNTLQFYGRTDNANYIPLVPVMTSDTTPSGVCSASSTYGTAQQAYRAFARDESLFWHGANGSSDQWVQYEFPKATHIDVFGFLNPSDNGTGTTTSLTLKASNDDFATETVLLTESGLAAGVWHMLDVTTSTNFKTYRVVINGKNNTYQSGNCAAMVQFYAKQKNTLIHSAVEDSIFYLDDGAPVALCTIPNDDTIDVDMEAFKGQTLTLVSTVAKDPTNLSNDFTMPVRITPNITEIYLMPLGSLYWYGYENISLTGGEDLTTWARQYTTRPISKGTANKNNYSCGGIHAGYCGYGTINKIDITGYTNLKVVLSAISDSFINNYSFLQASNNKTVIGDVDTTPTSSISQQPVARPTTAGLTTLDITSYNGDYAVGYYIYHTSTSVMTALWLE